MLNTPTQPVVQAGIGCGAKTGHSYWWGRPNTENAELGHTGHHAPALLQTQQESALFWNCPCSLNQNKQVVRLVKLLIAWKRICQHAPSITKLHDKPQREDSKWFEFWYTLITRRNQYLLSIAQLAISPSNFGHDFFPGKKPHNIKTHASLSNIQSCSTYCIAEDCIWRQGVGREGGKRRNKKPCHVPSACMQEKGVNPANQATPLPTSLYLSIVNCLLGLRVNQSRALMV